MTDNDPPTLTKQDETLSEQQRILLRSYYAEASLARYRAAKHREAGRLLQADVQDTLATNAELEAIQYRNTLP
jgi:hypothetical protein